MNGEELRNNIRKLARKPLEEISSEVSIDLNKKFLEVPIIVNNSDIVEGVLCTRYQGKGYLIAPSPQIGCYVGCAFCDMSDLPYRGNLSAKQIYEQVPLMLSQGINSGYDVENQPLKISFVKGGEGILNPEFPKALELIARDLPVPIKVSTTFPDVNNSRDTFRRIQEFAKNYDQVVQIQNSLISTDEEYRQSQARVPLIPFRDLKQIAENWRENVPNPRKFTLTFTLTQGTPCDPEEIYDVLPPENFAIRIRNWMPTNPGLDSGLIEPDQKKVFETTRKFEDYGYQLIPGKPGGTERKYKLTAGHLIKIYADLINRNEN